MKNIFIDGSAGTTGLRIKERLSERKDIRLLTLSEELRKDNQARRDMINMSDIVFLCLPDDAAIEAVSMIENNNTKVIDTSTAHRTNGEWTYGFPEIGGRREQIRSSSRIANPGCHASGFIALVAPLVECGIIGRNSDLSCFSLTGYSGGGKKMIAQYNDSARPVTFEAPRMYGLGQNHKHLPEMSVICGLDREPVFCPVVAPYYSGMQVTVSLFGSQINGTLKQVRQAYADYYTGKLVRFVENPDDGGFMSAGLFSGRDDMIVTVLGNDDRMTLVSVFDNLGKGASGAAIQNMNLMMGIDETEGLCIGGNL